MTDLYGLRGAKGRIKYVAYGDIYDVSALVPILSLIPGWRGHLEHLAMKTQLKFRVKAKLSSDINSALMPFCKGTTAALFYLSPPEKDTIAVGVVQRDNEFEFLKIFNSEAPAKTEEERALALEKITKKPFYVVTGSNDKKSKTLIFPLIKSTRDISDNELKTYYQSQQDQHSQSDSNAAFWQTLKTFSQNENSPLARTTNQLIESYSKQLPLTLAHGDFTSWNVICNDDGLYLIDCERSQPLPPAYDLFHWKLQPQFLRGKIPNLNNVIQLASDGYDLEISQARNALALYLLYQIALDSQSGHAATTKRSAAQKLLCPKILMVHQGYELYGSDRMFLHSAAALRDAFPHTQITIRLPQAGPLSKAFTKQNETCTFGGLFVLRKSDLKPPWQFLKAFPRHLYSCLKAWQEMRRHDLIYINSMMVLSHIAMRRLSMRPSLLHVHEIATGAEKLVLSAFAKFCGGRVIVNSSATKKGLVGLKAQQTELIYNGVDLAKFPVLPAAIKNDSEQFHLLILGRINALKGHRLLIEAIATLPEDLKQRVKLRCVGGVFEDQDHYRDKVIKTIDEKDLTAQVEILPFSDSPSAHYAWADCVVMPSTRPESFGLVAVEALLSNRAVIAAEIGGLKDVIRDGETGLLVPPSDAKGLSKALEKLIKDNALRLTLAKQGRADALNQFGLDDYKERIVQAAMRALKSL